MADDKKLTGIYFTIDTLRRLKIYAAKKLTNVTVVVEKAVKEFLDKEGG